TEAHNNVRILDGLINVVLGANTSFSGAGVSFSDTRYLGITVGANPEMVPRQILIPAFHSIRSERAYGLSARDDSPTDAVVVDANATVRVKGAASGASVRIFPDAANEQDAELVLSESVNETWGIKLKYDGVANHIGFYGFTSGPANELGPWLTIHRNTGRLTLAEDIWMNDANASITFNNANTRIERSDDDLIIWADDEVAINPDGDVRLDIDTLFVDSTDDRVGIGTTSPESTLFVQGNSGEPMIRARVGNSTKFLADSNGGTTIGEFAVPPTDGLRVAGDALVGGKQVPVGEERLRIVRGTVNSDASIRAGAGFTVNNVSAGRYFILFSTAFSD
ncbi:MAG: hypothetical protein AAF492_33380, partial [Verrucomicrobiota bacterium]